MTSYVRVRDDACSAISLGLMPGASYPFYRNGAGANSLQVVTISGDQVSVPKKLLELPAA
ncbi:hypothetical protein [Antarcticirhabdus aurantiaca]|uniref:Uncharacterized protein n=1 Tax=Antarcticirhabdus aurantiaca TaxID=2606717 RepID=A0ACD4NVZ4_9HYPH|nr:hypothetical protein OXU80_13655 [Jeongeuplla avenae]